MALTIHDQELNTVKEENRKLRQIGLMISGATGQGGSPGQLYKPPVTNPGRGEAVFGTEKDGQRFFEFLKASLQIRPNQIMLPFVPKEAETDDMYGEGVEEIEATGDSASGMNYPAPSELDKWLQLYQRNGGSLRHLDPDMRRLILQRGAMKAQGGNPFSTDALDKRKQIRDYLNNDQKVRELLIRQKKIKA